MANKTVERAYLDLARELYAEFDPGDPRDSESPDFVWPDGSLGVEVRGLFQESDESKFSVRQTEGFRAKVIRDAQKCYEREGGADAEVCINFLDENFGQQSSSSFGREIAHFVRQRRPECYRPTLYAGGHAGLPLGICNINISPPLPGRGAVWWGGGVGATVLLTHDLLANAIKDKNALIDSYRKKAATVWLLLVADFFPSSMSFGVPDEINQWTFCFAFDRVLLLSREEQRLWPLRRAT